MKFRPILSVVLCAGLVAGTNASSINYGQLAYTQDLQPNRNAASQTTPSDPAGQTEQKITAESMDQPEFVRLADGRLIPYGAGIICSDSCVESDVIGPRSSRKWLIAVPIIAGLAIGGVLLANADSTPVRIPSNVAGVTDPPTSTPTPVPSTTPGGTQPQPVPEPGTMALFGAGLAVLSRKKLLSWVRRDRN